MPHESHEPAADLGDDRPLPAFVRLAKSGGATTVLGAAMVAVGEILEPEKTSVEMVQPGNDEPGDEPFELDFGDLPSLD
ncbi:MAG: hypothetical protein ACE5GB_15340 [Acidimicrobiales bacterium]